MDCKQVKLSIIIPVYNTSPYLEKCLDSVLEAVSHVEDKVEILVINDGSTDNSRDIIEKYSSNNEELFRVFDKANGGLSDVKNYGLERASGEYVIFLDSDDSIEPEMYQEMLEKAKKENADVVACDIKLVYDDSSKDEDRPCATKSRAGIFSQLIDMSMMPASWNKIVKKELYKGLEFPVGINNEDVCVTPIVLGRANKIAIVEKPFYHYYQRTGSIQNGAFSEKRFVILETSKMCEERIKELDQEKQEKILGSIYLHQVLSMPFYLIRLEKFKRRYELLKVYMNKVEDYFPKFWDNFEIKEFVTWDSRHVRFFRKVSVYLLSKRQYYITCIFWSAINFTHKIYKKVKK